MKEISVVIPAHNEEKNLEKLVGKVDSILKGLSKSYEIIIVNDNSTDKSIHVLKQLSRKYRKMRFINRTTDKGVGNTIRDGFSVCNSKYIITMDADLSHSPNDMRRLYRKIREGYDIVIGSRYIKGGRMDSNRTRIVISRCYALFSRILGLDVHDVTTGYRIHKSAAIRKMNLKSKGFEIHAEIPFRAKKFNMRIAEIPIVYHRRKKGKSKLNYFREGPHYLAVAVRSRFI